VAEPQHRPGDSWLPVFRSSRAETDRGAVPICLPQGRASLLKVLSFWYVILTWAVGRNNAMVYVPGFDSDIFISYLREIERLEWRDFAWVKEFHRFFEREIKQRSASRDGLKICFDSGKLRGS
jgi:hypothetical protein